MDCLVSVSVRVFELHVACAIVVHPVRNGRVIWGEDGRPGRVRSILTTTRPAGAVTIPVTRYPVFREPVEDTHDQYPNAIYGTATAVDGAPAKKSWKPEADTDDSTSTGGFPAAYPEF